MVWLRPILLTLAAIVPGAIAAAPAAACVYSISACDDDDEFCHPTEEQKLEQLREGSANETRRLLAEMRARDRAGGVDHAAELAELLVPNIRPIFIQRSDCGVEGESDYGKGEATMFTQFRDLVSGTALEGSDINEFGPVLREDGYAFGPRCNAEFRAAFAERLRRSLSRDQLVQAWLFLGARQRTIALLGPRYHRLVSFEGDSRAPPVQWRPADPLIREQIRRAVRFTGWGRSLTAAADRFWTDWEARLADDAQACPATLAEWTAFRKTMVERMIAWREGRYRIGRRQ